MMIFDYACESDTVTSSLVRCARLKKDLIIGENLFHFAEDNRGTLYVLPISDTMEVVSDYNCIFRIFYTNIKCRKIPDVIKCFIV